MSSVVGPMPTSASRRVSSISSQSSSVRRPRASTFRSALPSAPERARRARNRVHRLVEASGRSRVGAGASAGRSSVAVAVDDSAPRSPGYGLASAGGSSARPRLRVTTTVSATTSRSATAAMMAIWMGSMGDPPGQGAVVSGGLGSRASPAAPRPWCSRGRCGCPGRTTGPPGARPWRRSRGHGSRRGSPRATAATPPRDGARARVVRRAPRRRRG